LWEIVAKIVNMPVIRDFESLAKWWIRGQKYNAVNVFHAFREKAGEVCKKLRKNCEELDAGEQNRRRCKARRLGTGAGEKWETAKHDVEVIFGGRGT
jgi:hypothetical protein